MHKSILFITLITLLPSAYAKRYALVIGNSNYTADIGGLRNPVNDATDMASMLKKKQFSVTVLKNASRRQMKRGIHAFTRQLNQKDAIGLFYFAGHGVEVGGRNYLIPIDANIQGQGDVEFEAIDAGRVMNGMKVAGNNLNMVILDACRNNPYARSFRSASRGLSRMDPPKGSLILYATSPGDVAADGTGRNGLFTQHLLQAIDTPNLTVEKVFKTTANKVYRATAKKQLPWQSGVMLGDFYFSEGASNQSIAVIPAFPVETANKQSENIFWTSIQNESDPAYFQSYLQQYPNGLYAALAKIKLNQSRATADSQSQLAHLTLKTSPADARIRILNIGPKYQAGIELKPGSYHIEVSKTGYQRHTEWLELAAEDKIHSVVLQEKLASINTSQQTPQENTAQVSKNEVVKTGCVSGNCSRGSGTYYFKGGNKYVGEYKNDKRNGDGTYYYKSGERYQGQFVNGDSSGIGTHYYKNGNKKYVGEYRNDKRNGSGTYYFENDNIYVGEFKNGKMNGDGTFYFKSGDKYIGEFKSDKRNGNGTYYYKNGGRYQGQFVDDDFSGMGTYYYKSGNKKYVGEYKNDKRNGSGTYYFENSNKYIGEFKNGKMNGTGTYYYKSGERYEGQFVDDDFSGMGTYYYKSGNKYFGEYKNDKMNGYGTKYFKDGSEQKGYWKDDSYIGK